MRCRKTGLCCTPSLADGALTSNDPRQSMCTAFNPNLRDLGVDRGPLTGGDAARSGLGWRVEWLLEGQRDGGAEQLEGSGLDGGGAGELLDLLPGEGDGLPVEGGQVLEQVAVAIGG